MGRGSSSKKVARAASTGGGRTARGRTPWLWYGGIGAVVVAGVLLIASSRSGLDPTIAPPDFSDHWHAAYGIYLCDEFTPGLTDTQGDRAGIHSHGDGLIHIHPKSPAATGDGATLDKFFTEVGVRATSSSIRIPGRDELENGDRCQGKKGTLRTLVWDSMTDDEPTEVDDPNDVRLAEGQLISVAFVADGTDVPKPPSVANLASPADLAPPGQTIPPATPTTTGSSETSTAPTAPATTAAR